MITTERIADLRTILNADLLDQGTAFYMACDDLPSALDTIEAQQRRIEELEAALIAMRTVMDNGPMPKRLDDALTWRQCDERARAMCDAALQPKEPS